MLASLIAFQIGYYQMHKWLAQFVKHTSIYCWIYPAIVVLTALQVILTVFWQIRKAARENSADVIKIH